MSRRTEGIDPREDPDPACSLPTSRATPDALSRLLIHSVVRWRRHALTYLPGGPTIAALTAVLLLSWPAWTGLSGPPRMLLLLGTAPYGAYRRRQPPEVPA